MAISATHLTNGTDVTTGLTSYTTASVTPSANALVLVMVRWTQDTGTAPNLTSVTGCGLTWQQVSTQLDFTTSPSRGVALYRAQGASPSAGALTFNFDAALSNTGNVIDWNVDQFTGVAVDTAHNGAAAVRQAVSNSSSSSTDFSAALSALASSSSAVYGAYGATGSTAPSAGTGLTVLGSLDTLPNITEWAINQTTVDATLSSAAAWGGYALEIVAVSGVVTDSFTQSENIVRNVHHSRSVSDTTSVTDSIKRGVGRRTSDTLTFSDSATKVTGGPNASDTFNFSESASSNRVVSRSVSDSFTMTDSATKTQSRSTTDNFAFSETLRVSVAAWSSQLTEFAPNVYRPNMAAPNSGVISSSASSGGTTTTGTVNTTTALVSSLSPSTYGQTITLTATVTPTSGPGTPSGTVTFRDGVTVLGTVTMVNGVAALLTGSVAAGSRSLTAIYSGDNSFNTSTSAALTQTVNTASTTTAISASPNPEVVGTPVQITATVAVTAPGTSISLSGIVTFYDGATNLGTASLRGNTASLVISTLGVGAHSLTAQYAGTSNYTGSTSPTFTETVNAHATSLAVTSTMVGASADYGKYIYKRPEKMDRINEPDYMTVSMVPWDGGFVKLTRGAYVTFTTATYGIWYTGYVTNDPEIELLGTLNKVPVYGYTYTLSADDYPLNLKPLGIVSPFLNTTQGEILRTLAQLLAPTLNFDLSMVQDGLSIARYVVDAEKHFGDLVKEFCDSANYRWSARNSRLYFTPSDAIAANLIIDGNDQHFTPADFKLTPSTDPIVNDAVVLGDLEPQTYMTEYFVGNGYSTKFPLVSSVFGVDSAILLDDDFKSSSIDDTKWNVFDDPQNYIQVFNGFLNALGGTNDNSFGVFIQSMNLIPLEGNIRITHGEYDFVQASDGVIGGLWSTEPNGSGGLQTALTNCVYGLRVTKSGTLTVIQPLVNGVPDGSQSWILPGYNYRYILRTIYGFNTFGRFEQEYSYLSSTGTVTVIGGNTAPDSAYYQSWITVVDPTTGQIVATHRFTNTGVPVPASVQYGYYMPLVLNDLHCTVTGITVWVPMQATLDVLPKKTPVWARQLVGPNEMDSFDGMAPVATIVDANQGATTRSTTLGRGQYNPGNAALEFFTDPSNPNGVPAAVGTPYVPNNVPAVGDLIALRYRRAASALARIQDKISIVSEAGSWGDNGLRSMTRRDLQPSPRTSAECEIAGQAIVSDFGRQHWDGTYKLTNLYSATGEITTGTVLKFQNLPSSFPASLTAELIQQVKTTMVAIHPVEVYEIEVTFGRRDHMKKVLAKFTKKVDVFSPQDSAEIPIAVDINSVGIVSAPDVVAPTLTRWDSQYLYLNTNESAPAAPPSGHGSGGFEVRYTDESWGCDSGRNLITRTSTQAFQVPRTLRNKVVFVKQYDARNQLNWAEDFTQWAHSVSPNPTATVVNATGYNPDGNLSQISTVTFSANGAYLHTDTLVPESTGLQLAWSVSVKAATAADIGKTLTLQYQDSLSPQTVRASQTVTLTKNWQRVTFPYTSGTALAGATYLLTIVAGSALSAAVTRASLELNTSVETAYCKTAGTPYGAVSRYAAGIHIALPLIPPAPDATVDTGHVTAPVITIPLTGNMQDVWGYEVRANDNVTVLQKEDLTATGNTLTYTMSGNRNRNFTLYVYFYNLLGEYSPAQTLSISIPLPVVSNVTVDDDSKKVTWNGVNGDSFLVEVALDSTFARVLSSRTVSVQEYTLPDADFFPLRYIAISPYDDLGPGNTSVINHVYDPASVVDFGNGYSYAAPIGAPPNPTTNPTPGTGTYDSGIYVQTSWLQYAINYGRY